MLRLPAPGNSSSGVIPPEIKCFFSSEWQKDEDFMPPASVQLCRQRHSPQHSSVPGSTAAPPPTPTGNNTMEKELLWVGTQPARAFYIKLLLQTLCQSFQGTAKCCKVNQNKMSVSLEYCKRSSSVQQQDHPEISFKMQAQQLGNQASAS